MNTFEATRPAVATTSTAPRAADAADRARRLRHLRERLYTALAAVCIAILLMNLTGCGGGGDDDLGLQLVALPADATACPAQPFVGPLPTWCVDTAGQPVPPSGKPQ